MRRIAIVTVHGIGSQGPDYADSFHKSIISKVGGDVDVKCFANLWQTAIAPDEEIILGTIKSYNPKWQWLRNIMVRYAGDALGYQLPSEGGVFKPLDTRFAEMYGAMHQRLDATLSAANDWIGEDGELILVSHSLGTVVASNFVWDATHPGSTGEATWKPTDSAKAALKRLKSFITLGSPVAVWSLRWPNQGTPIAVNRWLNVWCPTDVVGYPLSQLNGDYERLARDGKLIDMRMWVGGLFTFWNPVSHITYMDSQKVVGLVAAEALA